SNPPHSLVSLALFLHPPLSLSLSLFQGHSPQVTVTEPELCNHRNSSSPTGPTPDCSPPSPDTALKSIDRVIRPQPKQRTSLSSSLDVQNQRPVNHSCDPSEVSSSLGYASFSTSPPVSPNQDSPGSNDDCPLTVDLEVSIWTQFSSLYFTFLRILPQGFFLFFTLASSFTETLKGEGGMTPRR
uniref:Uncharacterized protein n=1 Tax=Hucho hucho TaxID=62062 RepID=A0A4W5JRV0_9TELE